MSSRGPNLRTNQGLVERMTNLQHAREVMSQRAVLRRQMMRGKVDIEELLSEQPAVIRSWKIYYLLCSVRGINYRRANRMLFASRVHRDARTGYIPAHKIERLIRNLPRSYHRYREEVKLQELRE